MGAGREDPVAEAEGVGVGEGDEGLGEPERAGAGLAGEVVDRPQECGRQGPVHDGAEAVEARVAGDGPVLAGALDPLDGAVLAQRQVGGLDGLQAAELAGLVEVGLLGEGPGRVERAGVQGPGDALPVGSAARDAGGVAGEDVDVRPVQPPAAQLDGGSARLVQRAGDRYDVPGEPGRCDRHPCVQPHSRQAVGIRLHGSALQRINPHAFAPSENSRTTSWAFFSFRP
ncbi:hypothetical protein [Streptomyces sp. adm13(2018)]|uniref:hypothetical protein n=1 Tax=Streptomyces sp. adm13(2018) TaxID=2479007 RepID=UPI00164FA59D|nr:hypothetical protein [Streptomyces sp. adm13(2018)]